MILVPARLTPLDDAGVCRALADGYATTMASAPSVGCLATLAGQVLLETGRGKRMRCWNPGNKKAPADWPGFFTSYDCDEIFDGATAKRAVALAPGLAILHPWHDGKVRVVLKAGHPWAAFVAFDSAAAGMADYLELLACSPRYRGAWSAFYRGDPELAVRALGRAGYFTADVETYVRAVVSIAKTVTPICELVMGGEGDTFTDDDRRHIDDLVAWTLAESARGIYEHASGRHEQPEPETLA